MLHYSIFLPPTQQSKAMMKRWGQIVCLAMLGLASHMVSAVAATHLTCTPEIFSQMTQQGEKERPYNDVHVIIEDKIVTIGIVNNFDVFSDWVFEINWQKGQRLTAQHDDGSLSFDGKMLQLAATQLVSGIAVMRASCR